jgi:xanthine dehydrogenase accessory factor
LVGRIDDIPSCHQNKTIPVIVDEDFSLCANIPSTVVIDARMLKQKVTITNNEIPLKIGLGPGFSPGENCDCVVETKRGPFLGRVYWSESAESDNGVPEKVGGYDNDRVLRSPDTGIFNAAVRIGDIVDEGEIVASVNNQNILASFRGIVRGLLHEGLAVTQKMKVGDLDPRCDPLLCNLVSDKALAIGGGVLEAILSKPENRDMLCTQDAYETH